LYKGFCNSYRRLEEVFHTGYYKHKCFSARDFKTACNTKGLPFSYVAIQLSETEKSKNVMLDSVHYRVEMKWLPSKQREVKFKEEITPLKPN